MVNEWFLYSGIDQARTGSRLRGMAKQNGYSAKQIQELLQLACPQPVYRWFKGKVLPSVDHLYVLSKVFHVHMEDLLVPRAERIQVSLGESPQKHLHHFLMSLEAALKD